MHRKLLLLVSLAVVLFAFAGLYALMRPPQLTLPADIEFVTRGATAVEHVIGQTGTRGARGEIELTLGGLEKSVQDWYVIHRPEAAAYVEADISQRLIGTPYRRVASGQWQQPGRPWTIQVYSKPAGGCYVSVKNRRRIDGVRGWLLTALR